MISVFISDENSENIYRYFLERSVDEQSKTLKKYKSGFYFLWWESNFSLFAFFKDFGILL